MKGDETRPPAGEGRRIGDRFRVGEFHAIQSWTTWIGGRALGALIRLWNVHRSWALCCSVRPPCSTG